MKKSFLPYLAAAASGFVLTGAFPRTGLDFLAWFAIAPLLWAISKAGLKRAFWLGFTAGLCHFVTLLYWIEFVMSTYGGLPVVLSYPVMLLLCLVMACYIGGFAALLRLSAPAPVMILVAAPALWTGLEYLRMHLFTGFPWANLGASQFERLALIQAADITGVFGISALIVLCNCAIFLLVAALLKINWGKSHPSLKTAAAGTAAAIICVAIFQGYGIKRLEQVRAEMEKAPKIAVSVVQGNVEQQFKWDPSFAGATAEKYLALSQEAAEQGAQFVIWPETALPFYFLRELELTAIVIDGIMQSRVPFLVGSPAVEPYKTGRAFYNRVFLIMPDGRLAGHYDKVHLVPWGEYVPLKRWMPFIGKLTHQVGDYSPGRPGKTLAFDNVRLGVLICYEVIFPSLSRAMAKNGANLLVTVTNDAWFGLSSAPYQHFSMVALRSVETKKALARAANTGISGFVMPDGAIVETSGLFVEGVFTQSLPLLEGKTVYVRFGDWFAQLLSILGLALIIYGLKKRAKA
ncbi:MAG: apolipoprotein N-acyltransferase [Desulfatibacillaceae bacterium]|nr:apolipoprotein N-acyltransferase [Desulfatibacillaceae bacterium]